MRVRPTGAGLAAVIALVATVSAADATAQALAAAEPAGLAAAPAALTVTAQADTYVAADAPARTHGSDPELVTDSSPAKISYLRFAVSGLTAPVAAATLRLHTRDTDNAGSPAAGQVSVVPATGWSESAMSYDNRPVGAVTPLATLGAVDRNRWYDLDVTAAVRGDGAVSFALSSGNADSAYFDSRERGVLAPHLVITTNSPVEPDPVLLAAGDIADCASTGDEATAALLDTLGGTIASLGDHAYLEGSPEQFAQCYDPSWGRHRARTRPAVGNHEYRTPGAAGYYAYFGAAAGDPAKGYYAYNLGQWHVVVLNSNCAFVSCAAGSAQERWLRADLAADTHSCTLAYWHHPLFTSAADHGPVTETRPLYQALYDAKAEVVLTGHNHNYERFAPQNPQGKLDTARGIREFVVGTGGASHYTFGPVRANSEVRNATVYGILRMTLRPTGYDWLFVPEAGQAFTDTGTGTCR